MVEIPEYFSRGPATPVTGWIDRDDPRFREDDYLANYQVALERALELAREWPNDRLHVTQVHFTAVINPGQILRCQTTLSPGS